MVENNNQPNSGEHVKPISDSALSQENNVIAPHDDQINSPAANDNGDDDLGKPKVALTRAEWIAVATLIAVVAQAVIYYYTLGEIRNTAQATRTAANAAQSQTNVAQAEASIMADQSQAVKDSAKAAKDSATAAGTLTEQNKELIGAAKTQANASISQAGTSQASARAAEKSADIASQTLNFGERPYLAVKEFKVTDFEVGKIPNIEVFLDNTGKTPALNVRGRDWMTFRQNRVLGKAEYATVGEMSQTVLQPQNVIKLSASMSGQGNKFSAEAVKTIVELLKRKEIWLFIYGIVDYDDGSNHHHILKFCGIYDPARNETDYCGEHNSSS